MAKKVVSGMRKIKSSCGNKLQIPRIEDDYASALFCCCLLLLGSLLHVLVRRSSSLQLNGSPLQQIDDTKLSEVSAISASSSFFSLYSADPSAISFQAVMVRYRCCFGSCRLRVGACAIGIVGIVNSIIALCAMLSLSADLSRDAQNALAMPVALALLHFGSAMLLIIGVLIGCHFLLLPFLLSCVLNVFACVLLSAWAVVRRHSMAPSVLPLVLFLSAGAALLLMWFLVIVSMTFVLIRDRKRTGYGEESDIENRNVERASSSIV